MYLLESAHRSNEVFSDYGTDTDLQQNEILKYSSYLKALGHDLSSKFENFIFHFFFNV